MKFVQNQQILVARKDDFHFRGQGGGQHGVIIRIAANGFGQGPRLHDRGCLLVNSKPGQFRRIQAELGAQFSGQFLQQNSRGEQFTGGQTTFDNVAA